MWLRHIHNATMHADRHDIIVREFYHTQNIRWVAVVVVVVVQRTERRQAPADTGTARAKCHPHSSLPETFHAQRGRLNKLVTWDALVAPSREETIALSDDLGPFRQSAAGVLAGHERVE